MNKPDINSILETLKVDRQTRNPYGRVNLELKNSTEKLYLQKVKIIDDVYDMGGAYWDFAPNNPVFCAFNAAGTIMLFTRAIDRKSAKQRLYVVFGVRFYS